MNRQGNSRGCVPTTEPPSTQTPSGPPLSEIGYFSSCDASPRFLNALPVGHCLGKSPDEYGPYSFARNFDLRKSTSVGLFHERTSSRPCVWPSGPGTTSP